SRIRRSPGWPGASCRSRSWWRSARRASRRGAGAYAERMRAALGVLADVCCVLIFVAIGRANHHAGDTLAGVVSTSWPFLAGLAAGELATRAWRRAVGPGPPGRGGGGGHTG